MGRIIEVTILPQGEIVVQTKGYAGGDCLQASKFLEQALGDVRTDSKSAEFYNSASSEQHVNQ
jgi:hypothetical protein